MSTQLVNAQAIPILFVIDQPDDWGLYMPQLIDLVRTRNSSIHILETGGPLGTGSFTSNAVHRQDKPSQDKPNQDKPSQDKSSETLEADAQSTTSVSTATPADTLEATADTTAFLEELLAYFRDAGISAQGEWKPDYDRTQLGPYADKIGAYTIAVIDHGFPVNVLQSAYVSVLESEGFEVVRLHPISAEELEHLRQSTVGMSGS
jgi:hypothetical protein